MITQMPLLDVPVCRTRLEIWKDRNGVLAYRRPENPWEEKDPQWIAAFYNVYKDIGHDAIFMDVDVVFHTVAQDGGNVFHGETEEEACCALAEAWKIKFLEGIIPTPV
jgi:hypothetical protein